MFRLTEQVVLHGCAHQDSDLDASDRRRPYVAAAWNASRPGHHQKYGQLARGLERPLLADSGILRISLKLILSEEI